MIYADQLVWDHGESVAALDPLVFDVAGERYVFPSVPDALVVAGLRVYAENVDVASRTGQHVPLSDSLVKGLFRPEQTHLTDAIRCDAMSPGAFSRLGSTLASLYVYGPDAAALTWADSSTAHLPSERVWQSLI